jgi:hypothetical protein
MIKTPKPILSRHRLPTRYRVGLVIGWMTPIILLLLTIIFSRGITLHLLDPRLWLPLLIMLLPALYVWREGVDVLPDGLLIRVHLPRYRAFTELDNWYLDSRPNRRLLTVWDQHNAKALECYAAHLTDLPALLAALKSNLRYRHWPY